jgi:hypothetical protein
MKTKNNSAVKTETSVKKNNHRLAKKKRNLFFSPTVHVIHFVLDGVLLSVKNERSNNTVPIATIIIKINCPNDHICTRSCKSSARARPVASRKR